jgi:GntR family transcriptional repressor for pyruvate dehydrogenase complex
MPRPSAPTSRADVLASLSVIDVARPADLILKQLNQLIATGALEPGDRMPAERDLAQQFGVGRSHVREALRRLEFYGILTTHPQSGTYVARLGVAALTNLIGNVLALDRDDIAALLETRVVLEVETARLAAERAVRADLDAIAKAQRAFHDRAAAGDPALQEDLTLHLAIAHAAHNAVLASLVGLIAPDVMRHHGENKTCSQARLTLVIGEHQDICDAIIARDVAGAGAAMHRHASMARAQYDGARRTAVKLVSEGRRKTSQQGIRRQPRLPSRNAPKSV